MGTRRCLSALVGLALLGTQFVSASSNAGDIPEPGEPVAGITATLTPPYTHYFVEDAFDNENYYYEVYWDETTAGEFSPAEFYGYDPEPQSCGTFYPNSNFGGGPTRPSGDALVYTENSALWHHPNGTGSGFCNHDGPDHPGLVMAEVYESYDPDIEATRHVGRSTDGAGDDYYYPPLPANIYHCEYDGSLEGDGDPCTVVVAPLLEYCRFHAAQLVIFALTGAVLRVENGEVVASLAGGAECAVPIDTLNRITVLGGGGNDHLEVDWPTLLSTRISVNLKGGSNTLSLTGSGGSDWFFLHGIPASPGFEGGFAFDFNNDHLPDFDAMNLQYLNVDLGAGNDTAKVFPQYLYPQFGNYSWNLDGGAGMDKAMMLPSGAGRYNFGSDTSVTPPTAMVNLDSDQGDGADVVGTNVETWFAKGTGMGDIFTGAGGAGTGGPFQFKLKLMGAGGDDLLIGGVKNDTLGGGAGSNDVCKGGKGTDTATGCEKKKGIPKPLFP